MALPAPTLSKSRYLSGLQCVKRLYLEVNRRDRAPGSTFGSRFDGGDAAVLLARTRHPGGVLVDVEYGQHEEAVALTARLLADVAVPALFEAAFLHDGVRIRTDLLLRNLDGTWDLQEVRPSTSVKETHLSDLAVQVYVLAGAGLRVRRAGVLLLDRRYVRGGGGLDVSALFCLKDLTAALEPHVAAVADNVAAFRDSLGATEVPAVAAGGQCWHPRECPFTGECVTPPGPFDVGQLPGSSKVVAALRAQGVHDLREVAAETRLSPAQRRVVDCAKTGRPYVGPGLRAALTNVTYPLHFMDFETWSPAIPRYPDTGVYKPLPTQWSVHTLHRDGTLTHAEFLHDADTNPRPAFAETLVGALGEEGSIVVYSKYERTQIHSLAEHAPDHRTRLLALVPRLVDLLPIVTDHYYHPELRGSFSIKRVLPALVPDLGYGDLTIHDGLMAAEMYGRMVDVATPAEERASIREGLLRYCERDTLAMVRVREALLALTGG